MFWLLASVFLLLLATLKRAGAHQHIVILQNHKAVRDRGPGFIFYNPWFENYKIIDTGILWQDLDALSLNSSGAPLVVGSFTYQVFDPRKASTTKFGPKDSVTTTLQNAISTVVQGVEIRDCFEDPQSIRDLIIDEANSRARPFGIKILSVSITDFPAHRQVAAQIAGLLTNTPDQLAHIIEQSNQVLHMYSESFEQA